MSGALDEAKFHLADNIDDVWAFKQWVGERHEGDVLGFDTETESLSPYRGDKIRLIQIGDTMQGWAFPPEWHGAALEILRGWDRDWVAHNSRFDCNWLRKQYQWKPPWHRIHDTLTQAHIDDPTRTRGLKPLSGMLIDQRAATSQTVLDKEMNLNDWDWKTIPVVRSGAGSSYWIYAALDPVLTCRLHNKFDHVRRDFKNAYELEMGAVRCIADMEWRGALVDLDYCRKMTKIIMEYSEKVRAWIREAYGIKNPGSTMQCIARFEELGRQITRYTKGGAKSLDKHQLQLFLIEADTVGNDLAEALLNLRRGEKQVGPYFSNFEALADENGIVHPTIWPVGTRTARMSITDPALQTLPRKDPTVRDAFIPHEGNALVLCDYDQIEMRLAAHFAQDEGLRRAFVEEDDFFNTVASQAWGDKVVKGDPRRQTMKNGCYGKLYGASVPKIAATAGVPTHTMELVMAQFDESYPGIRRLQNAIINVGRQRAADGGRPYIVTPTGRKLYADPGKEYTLTNYLIQSSAAEVLKRAICDLDAAGLGDYMILPVHDELVFDVPREDLDDVCRTIVDVMTDNSFFIPLTCDVDVQEERWGGKYRK